MFETGLPYPHHRSDFQFPSALRHIGFQFTLGAEMGALYFFVFSSFFICFVPATFIPFISLELWCHWRSNKNKITVLNSVFGLTYI